MAIFQNQYCLFLSVTEFILIVSMRAREMWTVSEGDWIAWGTVINRVEGCLSESILIVSVCHRIYIDCFCARDLS